MDKVRILSLDFDNMTMDEAAGKIQAALFNRKKLTVATVNPEIAYKCEKDGDVLALISGFDLVICDGVGVLYASKIVRRPLCGRVPGIELGERIMADMAESGRKLFLLGGAPGVAEKAAEKLSQKYTGLNICGTNDGYFKDSGAVVDKINQSGADAVFVCLGSPYQERWITENKDRLCACVYIGLGGSFDTYSGNVKRAPKVFRRLGLEWFHRLITRPSRFKRMLVLPKYIIRVMIKGKK